MTTPTTTPNTPYDNDPEAVAEARSIILSCLSCGFTRSLYEWDSNTNVYDDYYFCPKCDKSTYYYEMRAVAKRKDKENKK